MSTVFLTMTNVSRSGLLYAVVGRVFAVVGRVRSCSASYNKANPIMAFSFKVDSYCWFEDL